MVMKDRVPPRVSRGGKVLLLGAGLACLPWLPGMAAPRAEATLDPPPFASTTETAREDRDELKAQVLIKQAQLKKARAVENGAKLKLAQTMKLHKQGVISAEETEAAQTGFEVAEADREIAEAELNLALTRANKAVRNEAQEAKADRLREEVARLEEQLAAASRISKTSRNDPLIKTTRAKIESARRELEKAQGKPEPETKPEPASQPAASAEPGAKPALLRELLDREARVRRLNDEIRQLEGIADGLSRRSRDPERDPNVKAFRARIEEAYRMLEEARGKAEPETKPEAAPRPAANRDRKAAADRQRTMNGMRQIGIALHNYLDQHGTFPPQAIARKDGSPLLSWRVAILPYLDQDALYRKFRLDEPWDSEHNKALLMEMPDVFRSGSMAREDNEPWLTRFQCLVGGEEHPTVLNFPKATGIADITDGTSNTIAVIEAAGTVPWTKPDDLLPNGQEDEEVGRKTHQEGFLALFADGSVQAVGPNIDKDLLRALFTTRGGEVIDRSKIPPKALGDGRRFQVPGPGGSTVTFEVPVDAAADADEKAARIAAEVARLIAERVRNSGDDESASRAQAARDQARIREIRAQQAEARTADLEAQVAALRDQLQQAQHAEAAARLMAEKQRADAEASERQAVEAMKQFKEKVAKDEHDREAIGQKAEDMELIERLTRDERGDADIIREGFLTILGRSPTPDEYKSGLATFERLSKSHLRRAIIEQLVRQIRSYRDEPAKP